MKRGKPPRQQPEQPKVSNGKVERLLSKYGSGAGRFYPSARGPIVKGPDGQYLQRVTAVRPEQRGIVR